MFRMFFSIGLSFIIILGFASKELKASELMKHVNEEHVAHSHDHDHPHTHKHQNTPDKKDKKNDTSDHSHTYDILVLNSVWNIKPTEVESLKIDFVVRELQTDSMESNLSLKNFPLSIFRPPIIS
jgi:hypothetical protein